MLYPFSFLGRSLLELGGNNALIGNAVIRKDYTLIKWLFVSFLPVNSRETSSLYISCFFSFEIFIKIQTER